MYKKTVEKLMNVAYQRYLDALVDRSLTLDQAHLALKSDGLTLWEIAGLAKAVACIQCEEPAPEARPVEDVSSLFDSGVRNLEDAASGLTRLAGEYPHPQTKAVLLGSAARIYEHASEARASQSAG
jgi:hypothetical protein